MNLIRALLSLIFAVAFFIMLFVIAWYIALPLLFIILIIGAIGAIRTKLTFNKFSAQKGFDSATRLRQTHRVKNAKKGEVIDVDFTEI